MTAASSSAFLDRLLATVRRSPNVSALLHPVRGVWVHRRWRDVLSEVDRYARAFSQLGLRPGDTVAFDGEITARLFLAAASVQCSGGMVRTVPTGASVDNLGAIVSKTKLVAVVVQGRESVAKWARVEGAERPLPILFDHAVPNGRSPLPNVLPLDHARANGELAGWADGLPDERPLRVHVRPTWAEESTDWAAGLATLLDRWVEGSPLALPELLVTAARDRAAAEAGHWIASAATLNRAARAIEERLPAPRRLTGRLVQSALSGRQGPITYSIVRRLRRQLGLARLDGIELHADGPDLLAVATRQLFQALGTSVDRAAVQTSMPVTSELHVAAAA